MLYGTQTRSKLNFGGQMSAYDSLQNLPVHATKLLGQPPDCGFRWSIGLYPTTVPRGSRAARIWAPGVRVGAAWFDGPRDRLYSDICLTYLLNAPRFFSIILPLSLSSSPCTIATSKEVQSECDGGGTSFCGGLGGRRQMVRHVLDLGRAGSGFN